jgi:hypothetical protein
MALTLYINEYIYLFTCSANTGKDSTRLFGELEIAQESVNIIIYRDGVVGIVTGYEADRSGFDPRWGTRKFRHSPFKPALRSTLLLQWV